MSALKDTVSLMNSDDYKGSDCMNIMSVAEAVEMTGLSKQTLYSMMETGQADLGAVVKGDKRNTYIFYRPKVERFVNGGESEDVKKLIRSVESMSQLLTAVLLRTGNEDVLRT